LKERRRHTVSNQFNKGRIQFTPKEWRTQTSFYRTRRNSRSARPPHRYARLPGQHPPLLFTPLQVAISH
jgi:hypothetical protein